MEDFRGAADHIAPSLSTPRNPYPKSSVDLIHTWMHIELPVKFQERFLLPDRDVYVTKAKMMFTSHDSLLFLIPLDGVLRS